MHFGCCILICTDVRSLDNRAIDYTASGVILGIQSFNPPKNIFLS